MRQDALRSHCPINFALEAFGDKWSLLVFRDIVFRGKRTYGEFLKSEEGFSTNILAARLEHLEAEGLIQRQAHPTDARKSTFALTEKGLDLIPLMFEMVRWSAKYDVKSEARHIKKLVDAIDRDNRKISKKAIERVRNGKALFPEFLD